MMKFLGFLFLVALGIAGWGYMHGWFEVSKSEANGKTSYGVTIDNQKVSTDVEGMIRKGHDLLDSLDKKIAELRSKASKASADSKAKIEQQIQSLEAQKNAAAQSLKDAKDATADQASALQQRLEKALNDASTAVEKAGSGN